MNAGDIITIIFCLLVVSLIYSFSFLINMEEALTEQKYSQLRSEELVQVAMFADVLGNCMNFFLLAIIACLLLSIKTYLYHFQGSKSIYLMKRLANPKELWIRVFTLPAIGALTHIILAGILLALFYMSYISRSPVGCVEDGQWSYLINLWLGGSGL